MSQVDLLKKSHVFFLTYYGHAHHTQQCSQAYYYRMRLWLFVPHLTWHPFQIGAGGGTTDQSIKPFLHLAYLAFFARLSFTWLALDSLWSDTRKPTPSVLLTQVTNVVR